MARGRAVAVDPGSTYWHRRAMAEADKAFLARYPGRDFETQRRHLRWAARYEFKALGALNAEHPERARTRKILEESYLSCLRCSQGLYVERADG